MHILSHSSHKSALAITSLMLLTLLLSQGCVSQPSGSSSNTDEDMGPADMQSSAGDMTPSTDDGGDTPDMPAPEDMPAPQDMTAEDMGEECVPATEAEFCEDIISQGQCLPEATRPDGCGNTITISCMCADSNDDCISTGGGEYVCECAGEDDSTLCDLAGATCGNITVEDRCGLGRTINCDTCGPNENCAENVCECIPESDQSLCARGANGAPAQCGDVTVTDNCGDDRTVNCGMCAPENGTCTAENTCSLGCQTESKEAFCDRLAGPNGKDAILCGEHTAPSTNCPDIMLTFTCGDASACDQDGGALCCDGGGCSNDEFNTCVCEDVTPSPACTDGADRKCGDVTNACGDAVTCTCATDEVCDNTTSLCCLPESDQALCDAFHGANAPSACGGITVVDSCNQTRTINCGGCGADESCNNNLCECDPVACGGAECGTISNACGNVTPSCGTCSAAEMCMTNTCVCTPESDADLCMQAGHSCGDATVTDKCGSMRTINCGQCAGYDSCVTGAPNRCEVIEVQQPTPLSDQSFGFSVDIQGDLAIVGATPRGRTANTPLARAYRLNNDASNAWSSATQLNRPSTGGQNHDFFGYSVGVSETGIIVGSPNLTAPGVTTSDFGFTVYYPTNASSPRATLQSVNLAGEGTSVGIVAGPSGTISSSVSGAPLSPMLSSIDGYAITRLQDAAGNWADHTNGRLTTNSSSSRMGTSVAITPTVLAVGLPRADQVIVYTRSVFTNSWQTNSAITITNTQANLEFGAQVALSKDGKYVAIAALPSTASNQDMTTPSTVFIYEINTTTRQQVLLQTLTNNTSRSFGTSLAFSRGGSGSILFVGDPGRNISSTGEVQVYEFQTAGNVWPSTPQATIAPASISPGDFFGYALGADDNRLIVGAPGATANGLARAGKAYIFTIR